MACNPKLFCRGRFAAFSKPPVIRCHLVRVTVTRLPDGRAVPGPLWLWWAGPGVPDLDLIWRAYLHRFDIEKSKPRCCHSRGLSALSPVPSCPVFMRAA